MTGGDLTVPALVRHLERLLDDCRANCVTEADAMRAWRERAEMLLLRHLAGRGK